MSIFLYNAPMEKQIKIIKYSHSICAIYLIAELIIDSLIHTSLASFMANHNINSFVLYVIPLVFSMFNIILSAVTLIQMKKFDRKVFWMLLLSSLILIFSYYAMNAMHYSIQYYLLSGN